MRSNQLKVAAFMLQVPLVQFFPLCAFAQTPYTDFVFTPSSATTQVAEINIVTIPVESDQSVIVAVEADAAYHTLPDI